MPGTTDGTADRGDTWTPTEDAATVDQLMGKAAEKVVAPADETLPPKVGEKVEKTEKAEEPKAEEVAETAEETEAKAKVKDSRIPAARHKEILDKERARREAVETELAQYKQVGKITDLNADLSTAETSVLALEKEYADLLTDGKVAEATVVMAKIRRTERSIIEKSSEVREHAAEARAVERVRFDTTVERLETQFPQLKPGSDTFDADKVAEVLELKEAYEGKGYTPSAALQKAVKLIMPPETKAQEKVLEVTPNVDPKAVAAARKAAAVEKTAEAVAKTPASTGKVGQNSDVAGGNGGNALTAVDVMKMPYKDFSALDDNVLARLRGDVI